MAYNSSLYYYHANVISYDANTKSIILDQPVSISMGHNDIFGDITSHYSLTGNIINVNEAIQKGNGAPTLSTDENGNFSGILNIPPNTFQTGQRVFLVDNRVNIDDPASATTSASATFTAMGLQTQSQQYSYGPSVDSAKQKFTQVAQQSTSSSGSYTSTYISDYSSQTTLLNTICECDPLAQTFIIDKNNYPNGMFMRSIKVFFRTKPTGGIGNTSNISVSSSAPPITLYVVGTTNGYPNGNSLDYSRVTLNASEVNVSETPHYLDPTTWTEFIFDAPVYIQPGVLYAFILQSSAVEYTVYYGQQNATALPSTAKALPTDPNPTHTTKIGASPYVGSLFESQNAQTWSADQTKSLMFVITQYVYNVASQGIVQFSTPRGLPYRKLGAQDIYHKLDANSISNLYGNFAANTRQDAINLTTTDFIPTGTTINYTYQTILKSTQQVDGPYSVNPGKFGQPTSDSIPLDDGKGERILLNYIDNSFSMYASLATNDPNVSPIISDDGTTLFNVRYVINNMGIGNNVINLISGGTGYSNVNTKITLSAPDIGSDPAIIVPVISANGTIEDIYVAYEGSGYITTPTITITDSSPVPGNGAIVTVTGETSQHGGNSYSRYFTKAVVLAPGNDSGDLRVYVTAYKPLNTGIYVYYKILSSNDNQNFDDGNWQLATQIGNQNVYSSSRDQLIDYEYAPGTGGVADNTISYVSKNGQTYNNFIQYSIKIVMATSDPATVPYITGIQTIALPPGTNI